jgi:hypothetical protein
MNRILLLELASDNDREQWINALVAHIDFINRELCI